LEFCFCRDAAAFDAGDLEREGLGMGTIYKKLSSVAFGFRCGKARACKLDSAMLPGMSAKDQKKHSAKPHITIVGAGNLAGALATSLHRAGYGIEQIAVRNAKGSLRRAKWLANEVEASAAPIGRARINSDVVWLCVPDGAIASAASALKHSADWTGKIAFHSSGALSSAELNGLRRRGAAVASIHPLMTFVRGSRPSLTGVPFAIEGDTSAVRIARSIVKNVGGKAYTIRHEEKAAYHAWGTFASPLLTALLAVTEQVAAAAGVKSKAARQRVLPIVAQTIANYGSLGASAAFSGPLVRGDVETVKRHLQVLRKFPMELEVYVTLARAALHYLPVTQKEQLRKVLTQALR
jgi:predicted short-subunit dehydrogenase-like oxidoreductase (DUF2520 family)